MKQFDEIIDNTLIAIEEAIDACGEDIDYDTISGILTLDFPNGSKVIINRQSATGQLWIAARSGGFHLDWIDDDWLLQAENKSLSQLLSELCTQQLGSQVSLHIELD